MILLKISSMIQLERKRSEMKVSILEETENSIVLGLEESTCPYCGSNKLWIKGNWFQELNKKGIKEYLKKDVYLKKNRYYCTLCKGTFNLKTNFIDKIYDKNFKQILKFLIDKEIISLEKIDEDIRINLNLDENWLILNKKKKILTLINTETVEIKDFLMIEKNDNLIIEKKVKDFKEFIRKSKGK